MTAALFLILVLVWTCDGHYNYCGTTYYDCPSGSIESPFYPSLYSDSANCTYVLEAEELSSITLSFSSLDIEYDSNCTYDWVQISCESHNIGLPARYCGRNTPSKEVILSPCTEVEILFHSDNVIRGSGFEIEFEVSKIDCPDNCTVSNSCSCDKSNDSNTKPASIPKQGCSKNCFLSWSSDYCICPTTIDCGVTSDNDTRDDYHPYGLGNGSSANGSFEMFQSPNYPSSYPALSNCTYYLYADEPSSFNLSFKVLDIEYETTCVYDWVQIRCVSNDIGLPARYCGQYTNNSINITLSPCTEVEIMFHSDSSDAGSGFSISYEILEYDCPDNCSYSGNVCSCGNNDTNATMPMKPQKPPKCSKGCSMSSSSDYCICPMMIPPSTAFTLSDCGAMDYTGTSGMIVSPDFPSVYPDSANCSYYLYTDVLSSITLTFQFFDVEYEPKCKYDWVQISCESNDIGLPARYCGTYTPNSFNITLSPCKEVEIMFYSDTSMEGTGFSIQYEVSNIGNPNVPMPAAPSGCSSGCFMSFYSNYCVCPMMIPAATYFTDCGNTSFNGSWGIIESPNYPYSYLNLANCTYKIMADATSSITLSFQHLDIEYEKNCTFDWVQVSCDSHNTGSPARYCGQQVPNNTITFSPCTQVSVVFYSDASGTGTGFSISYEVDKVACPDNCAWMSNSSCFCGGDYSNSTMCSSNCFYFASSVFPPYCACPTMTELSVTSTTSPIPIVQKTSMSGRRTTKRMSTTSKKPMQARSTPSVRN